MVPFFKLNSSPQAGFDPRPVNDTSYEADDLPTKPPRLDLAYGYQGAKVNLPIVFLLLLKIKVFTNLTPPSLSALSEHIGAQHKFFTSKKHQAFLNNALVFEH